MSTDPHSFLCNNLVWHENIWYYRTIVDIFHRLEYNEFWKRWVFSEYFSTNLTVSLCSRMPQGGSLCLGCYNDSEGLKLLSAYVISDQGIIT